MIIRYQNQGQGLSVSQIQAQIPPAFTVASAMGAPPGMFDITVNPDPDAAAHSDLNDYMAQQGLVFVEDNPTTTLGLCEVFFSPEFNSDKGDYATHYIASGGQSFFSFRVPADFKTLVKVVMVGIPNNTQANGPFALSSNYGQPGEQFDAHSEADPAGTVSTTANQTFELDVSSVFSALSAGDYCGLDLNQNGISGGVHYLGLVLRYSNA